ncbi:polysaccharide biosynthesis C-terminal domain-containing protein [Petroclostridium sp. X23]|nr:polysaccharide biosynthesis C-terminal domain-containing protein [Petroclostridium sp. X23]WHH56942.1 polysaccharide biosynthesis C-terminal domain-containing protein [Petroclostridium sp. X23]
MGIPAININGAPIGTNLCYFLIVVLNFIEVKKAIGVKYRVVDFFIKPMIVTASMGIAVIFTYNHLMLRVQSNSLSVIAAIIVGVGIYTLMLFGVGCIKKEDIEMVPKGDKILLILKRFGLLK